MTEQINPSERDVIGVTPTGVEMHAHDPEDDVYHHPSPTPSEANRLATALSEPHVEEFAQQQNATRLETRGVNIEHDVIRGAGVYVGEHYAPTAGHLLIGDMIEPGLYAYRGYLDSLTKTIKTEPITLNTSDGPDKPIHQGHSVILDPDPNEPTHVSTRPTSEYKKVKAERDREKASNNRKRAGYDRFDR